MNIKMIKDFQTAHPDGVTIKTFSKGDEVSGDMADYLVSKGVAQEGSVKKEEPKQEEIKEPIRRRRRS